MRHLDIRFVVLGIISVGLSVGFSLFAWVSHEDLLTKIQTTILGLLLLLVAAVCWSLRWDWRKE